MKRLVIAVALGLACFGCSNDCDDAKDKLEECGIEGNGAEIDTDECSEKDECAAGCVNDASCDELKNPDLNGSFFKCVAACQ
jgi:hypothetical protein